MTTLFLATTGGHLNQLNDLAERFPPDADELWVTHANAQSRSMLEGRKVEFIPYVRVRSVPDVLRCVPTAHRLWRDQHISRAVTTGSGIALGFLPYLAARGVECHYIESAARVSGPSLTGRVLNRIPKIMLYTQYTRWAGGRWGYGGSVFDRFYPMADRRPCGTTVRVVVTTGTATEFPFRRLIERLAPLLAPGGELETALGRPVEVLWQTGCTPVDDLPVRGAEPVIAAHALDEAMARADIVVSHAGAGSALSALRAGRTPLIASRRAALGEAGDDHQQELADELTRRGLAHTERAEAITIDDLLQVVGASVGQSSQPPPFEVRS